MAIATVYEGTITPTAGTRTLIDAAYTTAGGYLILVDGTNLADPSELVTIDVERKVLTTDTARVAVDAYVAARGGGYISPEPPIYASPVAIAFYITVTAAANRAVKVTIQRLS